jgi:hypothetical protein
MKNEKKMRKIFTMGSDHLFPSNGLFNKNMKKSVCEKFSKQDISPGFHRRINS